MDASNMPPPPPVVVDDAGHDHGNRPPDSEPELVTVSAATSTPGAKSSVPRKRKAREDGQPAQPRRLTRSHEACARCRRKKSKCDSKHPSCSACLAAGVECVQEDRYRQTLKPRGYTDLLEAQIDKCAALLNKFIPGFKLEYLDYHLSNYGVVLPSADGNGEQFMTQGYIPAEHLQGVVPEYDPATGAPYAAGPPFTVESAMQPAPDAQTLINAAGSTNAGGLYDQQPVASTSRPAAKDTNGKGTDPMANDLTNTPGLVKAFVIGQGFAKDAKQGVLISYCYERPHLCLIHHSLLGEIPSQDILGSIPERRTGVVKRNPTVWNATALPRSGTQQPLHLPLDREVGGHMLTQYFQNLNPYRPIVDEVEFYAKLEVLYSSISPDAAVRASVASSKYADVVEDSGFLCTVYLLYALGTLHVYHMRIHEGDSSQAIAEPTWPTSEEFYDSALALKPELQNTVSTLQALLVLYWYLFTENHGKDTWRLVGNLVRLAVELGLHHDPREQPNTFSADEVQLRTRLWYIVLAHDRDASVMFGRPLAIQRADFNAPPPSRVSEQEVEVFAEHFELSSELLHIQGDFVNSLYRPGKLTGEQVVLRAIEVERSLEQWRKKLPEEYAQFMGGSLGLGREAKIAVVPTIVTPPRALTMLKYSILRLFLLRSVFNNNVVSAHVRHKALHDAVITAHNILIMEAQLTAYPETFFFLSPIPVHVAAMTILFASISKVETLAFGLAREDIILSLKILPVLRWRLPPAVQAKLFDSPTGAHKLIKTLGETVYGAFDKAGPIGSPFLIDEMYWLSNDMLRADTPPRIDEVWNPGKTPDETKGLPVGIGEETHEHKLIQNKGASLQDQRAQFEAASGHATASTAAPGGAAAGASALPMDVETDAAEDYDADSVQALLNNLDDPVHADGEPENGNPEKYLEAWSKRDAT
ncbi:hypothetical protein DL93DRAFT_2154390 [Clavulina sp. PMI_390]|nr:hypothetical protein DL93DRAFT_2154390 [Clavulina sp. PMI_390]